MIKVNRKRIKLLTLVSTMDTAQFSLSSSLTFDPFNWGFDDKPKMLVAVATDIEAYMQLNVIFINLEILSSVRGSKTGRLRALLIILISPDKFLYLKNNDLKNKPECTKLFFLSMFNIK